MAHEDQRALGRRGVDDRLEVAAEQVDGDRLAVLALSPAALRTAVAALVPVDGTGGAGQRGALEVPGVLTEAVAVAKDEGDRRPGLVAGLGPPRRPGLDLVRQLRAVLGDGHRGGAPQGAVRTGRVQCQPGLAAHAAAHRQPLHGDADRGAGGHHSYRGAREPRAPAPPRPGRRLDRPAGVLAHVGVPAPAFPAGETPPVRAISASVSGAAGAGAPGSLSACR